MWKGGERVRICRGTGIVLASYSGVNELVAPLCVLIPAFRGSADLKSQMLSRPPYLRSEDKLNTRHDRNVLVESGALAG